MIETNVNNASYNAIEEIRISYALQDVAKESRSPLSEVKEIFREVKDVEKVKQIIKVAEDLNMCPITVVTILKEFENE